MLHLNFDTGNFLEECMFHIVLTQVVEMHTLDLLCSDVLITSAIYPEVCFMCCYFKVVKHLCYPQNRDQSQSCSSVQFTSSIWTLMKIFYWIIWVIEQHSMWWNANILHRAWDLPFLIRYKWILIRYKWTDQDWNKSYILGKKVILWFLNTKWGNL